MIRRTLHNWITWNSAWYITVVLSILGLQKSIQPDVCYLLKAGGVECGSHGLKQGCLGTGI